jgi:TRAP-type mannitol/chloroaromatic compound transport system substrate-binding protein
MAGEGGFTVMSYQFDGWKGLEPDTISILRAILIAGNPSMAEKYKCLTAKEFRSLLQAALSTPIVQVTIKNAMDTVYCINKARLNQHYKKVDA